MGKDLEVETVIIARQDVLEDQQARTYADVLNDPVLAFDELLEFFSDGDRQRRMEDSEMHHDRSPLAGIVRELEAQPTINEYLASQAPQRTKRFRQMIGVVVRMIMERRGWQKTGRKGSLGVRANRNSRMPNHNSGGLAFWFIRSERYELKEGMPFRTVQERCQDLESAPRKHEAIIS